MISENPEKIKKSRVKFVSTSEKKGNKSRINFIVTGMYVPQLNLTLQGTTKGKLTMVANARKLGTT